MHTRRQFLGQGLALAAVGATVPSFLNHSAEAVEADGERILVVVQLAGGNDGLNTLIPFGDDAYHRLRPTLAVPQREVLRLNGQFGLHPGLAPLRPFYDQGALALVHGVGYPNPNRSHFRSMEIWETGSDADQHLSTGWLGRWFDATCRPKVDPAIGLQVGRRQTLAFANTRSLGVTLQQPEDYRWNAPDDGRQAAFAALNQPGEGAVGGLDFLAHTALNAQLSSAQVLRLAARRRDDAPYPATKLGRDLKLVGQMIAGGLPTRVYFVTLGGFDTHAQQDLQHAGLMRELADGLAAFMRDLRAQRNDSRVLVMGFSEFGRRVQENGSRGTDHGAAGPMFVLGTHAAGGLHGKAPSLTELERGDLRHTVDFRRVYASLLETWLGTRPEAVLGRRFEPLGLVKA